MNSEIRKMAESLQSNLLDFCARLIETRSDSGDEEKIAGLIADELEKLGYDEVFTDRWGNVCGVIRGERPGPVIMYNGHMDAVAPGDIAGWGGYDPYKAVIDTCGMLNPFTGETETTRVIHGRGSGDLKCNLASQIYAGAVLAKMKESGMSFGGTFLLTAVVLEENGEMMGTIKLCEEALKEKNLEPDAMVCCEPSSLRMMLGHRGRMEIRVEISGRSCHGSSPWLGVNAVEKSAKLIAKVEEMMVAKTIEDEHLGRPGIALTMYECFPNELCIVPDRAVIVYDRRLVPGETVEGAIAEIQKIADDIALEDPDFVASVSVNRNMRRSYTGLEEEIESSKEVWIIEEDHPFVRACSEGLEEIGEKAVYDYWAFSTDTPMVGTRMHKPVIGYGPGQEYLIHTPDEKVRIDFIERSLYAYVSMYLKASELPMDAFSA